MENRPPIPQSQPALEAEEFRRYARQMLLPEVGEEGQRRLKRARVLVVGVGGLGSPVASYLAAAGVGALGLVDDDEVDLSNLHRQPLHGTADLGLPKLESAAETLRDLNPHIALELHPERLTASNVRSLIRGHDLVVDGSDNFETRYALSDACVLEGIPLAWGAVLRFEGQFTLLATPAGPCYRCLFPEPPPAGVIPSCAEAGVLGVVPGIIGLLQANEVLKHLLGRGEAMVGRMLRFDALGSRFREIRLEKDPQCPSCGAEATIEEPLAMAESCRIDPKPKTGSTLEISVEELAELRQQPDGCILLDVRTTAEFRLAVIEGALEIPLHTLQARLPELDRGQPLAVICHHGGRSMQAVQFLRSEGFDRALNVRGGIDAWSTRIDPAIPRY